MSAHAAHLEPNDQLTLGEQGGRFARLAGLIGLVILLITFGVSFLYDEGLERFMHAYLVQFAYVLSLGLGGLFFVILHHLTRSGWSVVVRRLAEAIAMTLPFLALLLIPVLIGMHALYPWTHADHVAHDPILQGKVAYLNVPFFIVRQLLYFAVWIGLAWYFWRTSVRQDKSGDPALTSRLQRISPVGMLLYAATVTFASFDLLMTLDPHWYSTIFGVYYFSGATVGFLALLILLSMTLQKRGLLTQSITAEHYQDMGKLLFAFVFFWGYIAFSQYMLIWYGNIPEETLWMIRRGAATDHANPWTVVSLILLFGHFVIPFAALLSRHVKRRKASLGFWAGWMLVMHWFDMVWLVMPEFTVEYLAVGVIEVGCFIGMGGLFLAALAWAASRHSLVPLSDPRLEESLSFHNA